METHCVGLPETGEYDQALRVLQDLKAKSAEDPDFDLKHTDAHIHDIEQRKREETKKKIDDKLKEEELLQDARAKRSPRKSGCSCCSSPRKTPAGVDGTA